MEDRKILLFYKLAQNLAFAPTADQISYEKHIQQCFKGLIYAKYCLKQPSNDYLQQNLINLPLQTDFTKKTLFLDLDETLVSSTENLQDSNGKTLRFQQEDTTFCTISVRIRPYVQYMFDQLSRFYEIYIFSAGKQSYVDEVVNLIDPKHLYINGVLSQNNCLKTKMNMFIKDLRIINNRKLQEMIIVDNFVFSYAYQIDNGIPVIPWRGDMDDKQLVGLTNYLIYLASFSDLPKANQSLQNYQYF